MDFMALQHEIKRLIERHLQVVRDFEDGIEDLEIRRQTVEEAKSLKAIIEDLHRQSKRMVKKNQENEAKEQVEYNFDDDPKEMTEFLKDLGLEPRSNTDDSANRKSRRQRVPVSRSVLNYKPEQAKTPPKKKLKPKKSLDEPRPSSTPTASSTMLPVRFINETSVVCSICRKSYKIHHVNSPSSSEASVTTQRNICFACQVAMDTEQMINSIIDQTDPKKSSANFANLQNSQTANDAEQSTTSAPSTQISGEQME